jgi:oligoendopeptidase F
MLHLFETADVSTLVHELAHMLRRQLSPEDLAIVEKWLKVRLVS